ncbi:MAG: M23 family metallopeptidase [Bacteroidota bacterium]
MRKEKFIYNTNTLRYEKVEVSWKTRLMQGVSFFSAVLVFSSIIVLLVYRFLDSPKEKELKTEITFMEKQYDLLNDQISVYDKILHNMKDRDDNIYRMMFSMDPIDSYVWDGGTGGSQKYEQLKNFSNSQLMTETSRKIDKLGRQLAIQSLSLDTISTMLEEKEKMLAAIPSIRPVRNLTRDIKLFSGFGMRIHPIHKVKKMHWGIDFTAPKGTKVYATGNGKVVDIGRSKSGYGNKIIIDHGYGYKTLYAHLASIDVVKGQVVMKGEVIGSVGNTGTSTAPHLHYEVIQKGHKVNPIHFCMDGLTPEEYREMAEMAAVGNQSFDFGGEEHTGLDD